ncbi:hypothetical protein BRD00_07410 [Halobacteriales archaeon QS_8_69_26]|nr:MAG: hypothetical protein BRD00_07410 [Halobacteriales archaeon QS_8_69_26]
MSEKSDKRTVKDIDHTHPHHDEPFGTNGVYDRGTSGNSEEDPEADGDTASEEDPDARTDGRGPGDTATDGGPTGDRPEGPSRADSEWPRRVRDIDHTPPDDVGAQRTFDRGGEAAAEDPDEENAGDGPDVGETDAPDDGV